MFTTAPVVVSLLVLSTFALASSTPIPAPHADLHASRRRISRRELEDWSAGYRRTGPGGMEASLDSRGDSVGAAAQEEAVLGAVARDGGGRKRQEAGGSTMVEVTESTVQIPS